MELTVKERLVLLQALPPTGNLTELRIIRELRDGLSFSEEEHKEFGIVFGDTGVRWEDTAATKEIEIGDVARSIIVRRLKELNRQGQLTEDHLDIIPKFPEVEE